MGLVLLQLGFIAAHWLKDCLQRESDAAFKRADINTVTMETSFLSGSPSAKQVLFSLPGPQLSTHAYSMS